MNERSRRIWAATEARSIGWGGVSLVAEATGMARNTIAVGIRELKGAGGERRWTETVCAGLWVGASA